MTASASEDPEGASTSIPHSLLACAICFFLTFTVFGSTIEGGFVNVDDDQIFGAAPYFGGFSGDHLHWMATAKWMGQYQPLTWLTYAVDRVLASGSVRAHHVTNVLLHASAAVAFLLAALSFCRRILARANGLEGTGLLFAAFLSAMVFAVHPLRVEPVAWVTGRNDVLAGLFALLALWAWIEFAGTSPLSRPSAKRLGSAAALSAAAAFLAWTSLDFDDDNRLHVRGTAGALGLIASGLTWGVVVGLVVVSAGHLRSRFAYLLALLCFSLSLLAKPSAIGLPLVLVLLDVWPFRRCETARSNESLGVVLRASLCEKSPWFVASLLAGALAEWAKRGAVAPLPLATPPDFVSRLAQSAYGLVFYPWKTLVPTALVPFYDRPASIEWHAPRFLIPLVAVVLVSASLVLARRRVPAALLAWSAFVVLIAPTLGLVGFGLQLVADRYSYVAGVPFALLLGGAWWRYGWSNPRLRSVSVTAGLLAVGALGVLSWRQSRVWHDSSTLWEHALRHSESPRILANAALTDSDLARNEPARRDFLLARAVERARLALERSIETRVYFPQYRLHYGTVLLNAGQTSEAISQLEEAVTEDRNLSQAWINLGLAQLRAGEYRRAKESLETALSLTASSADTWRLYGFACEGAGDEKAAIEAYGRSLQIMPGQRTILARLEALRTGS